MDLYYELDFLKKTEVENLVENLFLQEARSTDMSLEKKIVRLYRGMLRYAPTLRITDRSYYQRYIRREFERYKNEDLSREMRKKRYEKGKKLLDDSMGGLL